MPLWGAFMGGGVDCDVPVGATTTDGDGGVGHGVAAGSATFGCGGRLGKEVTVGSATTGLGGFGPGRAAAPPSGG